MTYMLFVDDDDDANNYDYNDNIIVTCEILVRLERV